MSSRPLDRNIINDNNNNVTSNENNNDIVNKIYVLLEVSDNNDTDAERITYKNFQID